MKRKKKNEIFDYIMIVISAMALISVLYPLILVVSNSISDPTLVARGEVVLLPKGINLEGYKYLLADNSIVRGYYHLSLHL